MLNPNSKVRKLRGVLVGGLAVGLTLAMGCYGGGGYPAPGEGQGGDFMMSETDLAQKTSQMLSEFVARPDLQPSTAALLRMLAENPRPELLAQAGLKTEDLMPLFRKEMPSEQMIRQVATRLGEKDEVVRDLATAFVALVH